MGIKGSATCVLNFDGATGYMIGEKDKGLNARLDEDNISSKKALTVFGIPCPPYFGSHDKDCQPSSINLL